MQYQYYRVAVAMFFCLSIALGFTKAEDIGATATKVYTNKFPVRILDVPSTSHPEVKSSRLYYGMGNTEILEHIKKFH